MSIDDPGWGGDSFGGTGGGGGDGWGDPGKPPSNRPGWLKTPYIAGGAAAVVVIVVIVLVVSLSGGSKAKPKAAVESSTPVSSPAATSSSASPTPSPSKSVETIADYDNAADAVCTKWKSRVTAANDETTEPSQLVSIDLPVIEGEYADLNKIPTPSTKATQQHLWLTQIETVMNNLKNENVSALNPSIQVADTTAGDLGMKVCNYGY